MSRTPLTIGIILGALQFTGSDAHCQCPCDSILQGIHSQFRYENTMAYRAKVKKVFEDSQDSYKSAKEKGEAAGDFDYLKILNGAFKLGMETEETRQFRRLLMLNESLAWQSQEHTKFALQFADRSVVDAWEKCMADWLKTIQRGARLTTIGDPAGEFIATLTYFPAGAGDPEELVIKGVTSAGVQPVGENAFKGGVRVRAYASVSQLFTRKVEKAGGIAVDFEKYPPASMSLAAIPPPPPSQGSESVATPIPPPDPPKPDTPPTAEVISMTISGRTEGDNKDDQKHLGIRICAGGRDFGQFAVGEIARYADGATIKDADLPTTAVPGFKPFPVTKTVNLHVFASPHHDVECWLKVAYEVQTYSWGYDRQTKTFKPIADKTTKKGAFQTEKIHYRGDRKQEGLNEKEWDFDVHAN